MYPPDTVYFYARTDRFSEFSNFAPYGIAMDDAWWPTVEHYFQAQKFHDPGYRERIRRVRRPKDAKSLGMTRSYPLRPDWEQVKDDVMDAAVLTKFRTHGQLAGLCRRRARGRSSRMRRWTPTGGADRMVSVGTGSGSS